MADDSANDAGGHPGFIDLIGLQFETIEDGYSRATLPVTDRLLNPYGTLHGAATYAMADTGMGAAISPGLAEDETSATIEISIGFMRPVSDGTLTCETSVDHRGRSVVHLESEIQDDEDALVARATGSFSIIEE